MKKLSIRFLMAVIMVAAICPGVSRADEALSWYDCIKEAQKNHPDLISAQGAISQSEAAKQTAASGLFPQISADLQASRGETTTGNSSGRTHRTQNSYGYGAQGSQLLFDGLKTIDNTHAAVENIKAAEYNFKFISSEVRLRLRGAFIALLKAQEALTITEDIRKIRQSNLDLITLRYKSGMEHKGALMTAEANLAQAAFEIAQARRALEVAQRSLTKEMGRSLFAALRAQGELSVAERSLQRPDFEALAAQNPSLERLDALTKAASYTIKSAQGSYLPQLSAQVSAGRTDTSWLPQNDQWNAGLTLSYPIFEGGLRSAEVGQARAAFIQARENQRSAKDGIVLALEQTWAALQDAAETVDVQRKFLEAAEERAKIAEQQYSLGLLLYDNWTIIEDGLVQAKKTYLNAQAGALAAEATWIQAKGETLEYAQ